MVPRNLHWQKVGLVSWTRGWRWLGQSQTYIALYSQPISVPLSQRCLPLSETKSNVCVISYEITATRSVQWLCKSAQNRISCGQWDAAGAEGLTCTNLMARLLVGGAVLARVYVGVHTLPPAYAPADGQQQREGLLVGETNLLYANSSGSAFYLEEIMVVYLTNKPALLASALRAMVITQIFGQSCHIYSTKLINLCNEYRTVTNTDPTSKAGIAAVCWPEF